MIGIDWFALIITFVVALAWLRLNDYLAHRGIISSQLSRKIIHIGTGPIFVLCWLLFSDKFSARLLAALVPFAITLQFLLIGIGLIKDQASVDAMSRHGDRREILKGPLFYGIVFVLVTIVFWEVTPIGIVALMILCGGDGLADIVGNRIPSKKIPWSRRKSIAGTIAMFLGGWLFSFLVLAIFISVGAIPVSISNILLPITLISAICTIVETLPFKDLDNITVPITAIILGLLLF